MTEFSYHFAYLSESIGRKRSQFVAIFIMAGKREHLTAEPHELNSVLVIPADHLDHITCIGQTEFLDVPLSSCEICGLIFVGPVLSSMFGLRGVFERMSMF
jgi:hypothetical protein